MKKLYIIGLGPGSVDHLSLAAVKKIHDDNINIIRTKEHPTLEYFYENEIDFQSYDYLYEEAEYFEEVYGKIVKDLQAKLDEHKEVNYFVPGNPMVAERTVKELLALEGRDFEIEIISGLSFIEPVLEAVGRDPIDGLKILDGSDLSFEDIDINVDCILTQVYNRRIASDIKLLLSEVYGDEYKVYLLNAAGIDAIEEVSFIPLYELDRQENIGHLTSLYIPRIDVEKDEKYSISDIIYTMARLRGENGCSWDRKQTYTSLRNYIIEEAFELVDALSEGHIENIIEETGDLLLQVVFLSQIGWDEGDFNFYDVTTELNKKLINRHPHVFSNKDVENEEEIIYNWNGLKYKEKKLSRLSDKLKDVAEGSSLLRSRKIQKIMSDKGFDWVDIEGPFDKIEEEANEIKELIENKEEDHGCYEDELGDLLFSVVNLSRFLGVDPEISLNKATNKFVSRVGEMEDLASRKNIDLDSLSLEEWDLLWKESKLKEK